MDFVVYLGFVVQRDGFWFELGIRTERWFLLFVKLGFVVQRDSRVLCVSVLVSMGRSVGSFVCFVGWLIGSHMMSRIYICV